MAKQRTVRFIPLGDLKGVVLECTKCASYTSIAFSEAKKMVPKSCPACNIDWDRADSGGPNSRVEEFIRAQQALMGALKEYTVSLEVDFPEPAPGAL